jgi:hypothetical protein
VAKASRKSRATGPLQPADFPAPKRLSREKFSEICAGFEISDRHATELKDYLDELVSYLHDWMSQEKAANRRADRDRIIKIRNRITAAQYELNGLGIDGRLAVRSTADRLADILSGDWLRYHFPGDAPSRTTPRVPPPRAHRTMREPSLDEKYSNYEFIRHRARETLLALLRDLESVLASALTSLDSDPRARGGRQPLAYRQNVILNLASIWHGIGQKVVGTHNSDFVVFCNYIFEVWGWPTDGLGRAIPNAIKDFRSRQKNPARLRE